MRNGIILEIIEESLEEGIKKGIKKGMEEEDILGRKIVDEAVEKVISEGIGEREKLGEKIDIAIDEKTEGSRIAGNMLKYEIPEDIIYKCTGVSPEILSLLKNFIADIDIEN